MDPHPTRTTTRMGCGSMGGADGRREKHVGVLGLGSMHAGRGGFPTGIEVVPLIFGVVGGWMAFRIWRGLGAVPWGPRNNVGWESLARGLAPLSAFWCLIAIAVPTLWWASGLRNHAVKAAFGVVVIALFVGAVICFVVAQLLIFRSKPTWLIPPPLRR